MTTLDSSTTRLMEYIKEVLPWAHGHQLKAFTTFVAAILDKQTGTQAALARTVGNQEAATKRLSRLMHNERLRPHALADAVLAQALRQLPRTGTVRLAIDWTIEGTQYLLVVSLVTGGRAVPIYWRASDQAVLKGRMRRYEMAVIKRVLRQGRRRIGRRRLRVTADRGFADVALCDLLEVCETIYIIRVKSSTKVYLDGEWRQLQSLRFVSNARQRNVGRVWYCASSPHTLWVGMSRARNAAGEWEVWYLLSNGAARAGQMASEYARRFGCEQGFRDVKRRLGFADARVPQITAWSRFFALFAIALLVLATLGAQLLLGGAGRARELLRRVASRRRGRCELSVVSAILSLLAQDRSLYQHLLGRTKLNLESRLANVS
ncbi:MAG: transposase [Acidobacteriota bacterium]|nr:transposase [Acidobacteriota bacterium]